jgi:RHS repeat-associated protein
VYVRWGAGSGHATNATHTVHHAGGSTQVVVNQQQNGGEWVPLGTYGFAQDLNHGVVLTDQADGMVVADEMRFEVSDVAAFTYYLQPDHLDTPRVATDGALAIRWRWDASDPFGSLPPTSVANGIELQDRFPGQVRERNVTTGLHYNYFRDYDPAIGRYIQSDPIGLQGGINTYAYVGSNPLSRIDPLGLDWGICCANKPNRPTSDDEDRAGATGDFSRNYLHMQYANTIDADKYCHCKANCEAAQRGPAGYQRAQTLSDLREASDLRRGKAHDSYADPWANSYGREFGKQDPCGDCRVVCSVFRPKGLSARF